MTLYFITGSENKFKEVQAIIPQIKQLEMDLPEIQETDPQKIVAEKLYYALNQNKEKDIIVEDTSLHLDCLGGLPGPLIKWFLKTIGNEGIAEITEKFFNNRAEAKTIIGYAKNKNEIMFFEGSVYGRIVRPRGNSNFGWNDIFEPKEIYRTFGEMTFEEKNLVSMRGIAARKLKDYLDNKS